MALGALVGLGIIGTVYGFRASTPSLEAITGAMSRPAAKADGGGRSRASAGIGRAIVEWADTTALSTNPRWLALQPSLVITGETAEGLVSKMVVGGGIGLIGPALLWMAAAMAGGTVAPLGPVLLTMIALPVGTFLPVVRLLGRARDRRRHFRVVISSFVDLVVLSLAGGVGIEGALQAASQVSGDWAARRMARVLSTARDGGLSPWAALGRLGSEIGVSELVELSTTLELAGTEGARIRQALSARAVALRRHEQADAESSANAMTERLFLPGALLLFGFLLFIGYPAFSRVIGGL